MRIAAVLAGFTMGQSDVLRKAMGKKDPKVMAKQREAFMAGAPANGVNEKKAKKIFDLMEFFAGYGFNKSHSTTYAWVAYQTGVPQGELPVALHGGAADDRSGQHRQAGDVPRRVPRSRRADPAARHQHQPARVHRRERKASASACARSRTSARARSCRCSACARSSGAIDSLYTLCEQVDQRLVNKRPLESLVKAGAFDSLCRPGTIAVAARPAVRRRRQGDRARQPPSARSRQGTEPARSAAAATRTAAAGGRSPLPDAPPWTESQQLAFEKEALGLYMSGHPLERFTERAQGLRRAARRRADRLAARRLGRRHRQRPASAEDEEGRPHGGLHARRHRRRHRGRGLPGDLRQVRPPHRRRRDAARPRQARERRRDRRASSRPSCSRSRCSRSGRRARW